ncbi:MAG: hypothetical protein HYT61_00605 [Candidatus Yanofskybacteria bacterium]|nr:hypothetical protein [Candidatus Yanofskybacteria bacterium]
MQELMNLKHECDLMTERIRSTRANIEYLIDSIKDRSPKGVDPEKWKKFLAEWNSFQIEYSNFQF